MDALRPYLPSAEKGYLPYYLCLVRRRCRAADHPPSSAVSLTPPPPQQVSVIAMGNALQNLTTLHYTRRIYNAKFVPNHGEPEDSTAVLKPASATGKDAEKGKDQVTPLAARLMGIYTFCAGLIRFYASYRVEDPSLYQLSIWTHVIAAAHFTSEMFIFKTIKFSGPQALPFMFAYGGSLWMFLQWDHYVQ